MEFCVWRVLSRYMRGFRCSSSGMYVLCGKHGVVVREHRAMGRMYFGMM